MEETEKAHDRSFAMGDDVEIRAGMLVMNLLHRAMESPDDVAAEKGKLRDDLHVA